MARREDTVTFSRSRHSKTLEDMHARRERVHEKGEKIFDETGELDKLVNVKKSRRLSHNSMTAEGKVFVLSNGIALPIISACDGTGSMGENVARAFTAMGKIDSLFGPIRSKFGYNTQIATGVAQDVLDTHPVAQLSQFESDNRIAEQMRLLVPDKHGHDSTEDYQVLMAYAAMASDLDVVNFYGLKGYFFMVADEICREETTKKEMLDRTGLKLQAESMSMKSICRALLKSYHTFYIQVGNDRRNSVTEWWEDKLGAGRVIIVPNPDYLAEVQAALIFCLESKSPTKNDVVSFLIEGTKSNEPLSKAQAEEIWSWILEAKIKFGAQAKLRADLGVDLPKPGDIFAHFRHAWPIGHPRASENVIPADDETRLLPKKSGGDKFDWSKF